MIFQTQQIESRLHELHEAVYQFFESLPNLEKFSDYVFPAWLISDYGTTHLFKKLESIYDLFNTIEYPSLKQSLIMIFKINNEVKHICLRKPCATYIEKEELKSYFDQYAEGLIDEISDFFDALYDNYLNRQQFNTRVSLTIREHIRKFNRTNGRVCGFCGLKDNMVVNGQARPALDHWLPKSKFPFTAINFDNLIPACEPCNERKDATNFLTDDYTQLEVGYYPYENKGGIITQFSFDRTPITPDLIAPTNMTITIQPEIEDDRGLFNAWLKVFNIEERYHSFVVEIYRDWEGEYESYITNTETLSHANSVGEFKQNIRQFRDRYLLNYNPGAIIYHAICNYLIDRADNIYLTGLYRRFLA